MLLGRQRQRASGRAGEIDHADVFVRRMDPVDIEEARGDQGPGSGLGGRRPFAQKLDLEAAFLPRLPQRGLLGILVQFDMTSEREPLPQLAVQDQQHLRLADDEDGHGEVDFFVQVGHGIIAGRRVRP